MVVAVVVAGFTDWRNCLKSASTSALLVVCWTGGNVVVFKFKSSNSLGLNVVLCDEDDFVVFLDFKMLMISDLIVPCGILGLEVVVSSGA